MAKISKIYSDEILDSRGIPTLKTSVLLTDGSFGEACVPSGTSTGKNEAWELRDNDSKRYDGKGVLKAVQNVNETIFKALRGKDSKDQQEIDRLMVDLDGSKNKSNLGANSILSVSLAIAVAEAASQKMPLYEYLRDLLGINDSEYKFPTPMVNLIEGGRHVKNGLDFQEFLVIPFDFPTIKNKLDLLNKLISQVNTSLKKNRFDGQLGQEGGFAAHLPSNEASIAFLKNILSENFKTGKFYVGIDAAASSFFKNNEYYLRDSQNPFSNEKLIEFYNKLQENYGLFSIEDPFDEGDLIGWKLAKKQLSPKSLLIADDLTTTNVERLRKALSDNLIDGVIVKPNQIGTLSETLEFIREAEEKKLKIIISHRAGETMDTFISDLAVAVKADFIKIGCPSQKERLVKYERLIEIGKELKLPV